MVFPPKRLRTLLHYHKWHFKTTQKWYMFIWRHLINDYWFNPETGFNNDCSAKYMSQESPGTSNFQMNRLYLHWQLFLRLLYRLSAYQNNIYLNCPKINRVALSLTFIVGITLSSIITMMNMSLMNIGFFLDFRLECVFLIRGKMDVCFSNYTVKKLI